MRVKWLMGGKYRRPFLGDRRCGCADLLPSLLTLLSCLPSLAVPADSLTEQGMPQGTAPSKQVGTHPQNGTAQKSPSGKNQLSKQAGQEHFDPKGQSAHRLHIDKETARHSPYGGPAKQAVVGVVAEQDQSNGGGDDQQDVFCEAGDLVGFGASLFSP